MVFPRLTRADYSKDLEPRFNPRRCGGCSQAAGPGVIHEGPPSPFPWGHAAASGLIWDRIGDEKRFVVFSAWRGGVYLLRGQKKNLKNPKAAWG